MEKKKGVGCFEVETTSRRMQLNAFLKKKYVRKNLEMRYGRIFLEKKFSKNYNFILFFSTEWEMERNYRPTLVLQFEELKVAKYTQNRNVGFGDFPFIEEPLMSP